MEVLTITIVILGVIASIGWAVMEFLTDRRSEDSSYNMHPSNFEKQPVEYVQDGKKVQEGRVEIQAFLKNEKDSD